MSSAKYRKASNWRKTTANEGSLSSGMERRRDGPFSTDKWQRWFQHSTLLECRLSLVRGTSTRTWMYNVSSAVNTTPTGGRDFFDPSGYKDIRRQLAHYNRNLIRRLPTSGTVYIFRIYVKGNNTGASFSLVCSLSSPLPQTARALLLRSLRKCQNT